MKRIYVVGLMLLIAVLACTSPDGITATPVSTDEVPTIVGSDTPEPTETETVVPSNTPVPTATSLPMGGQLFRNGGMESICSDYELVENPNDYAYAHIIPCGSTIWYAGVNYLDNPVPALFAGQQNPADLVYGRPEAKFSDIVRPTNEQCVDPLRSRDIDLACQHYRVNSGRYAIQLFWYARPGYGGWQQEIWLPSRGYNSTCEFRANFQPWISDGTEGLVSTPAQYNATDDDKLALRFGMYITDGLMLRNGTNVIAQRIWRHSELTYDDYAEYVMTFELPANVDRIYAAFGVQTAWPWPNQDFYFDDVSLRCTGINFNELPDATPTPIGNEPADAGSIIVTPMFQPNPYVVFAEYTPATARNIRAQPIVHSSTYTGRLLNGGQSVKIYLRYDDPYSDDFWGCLKPATIYTCIGEGGSVCTLVCNDWVAIYYQNEFTGEYKEIELDG